MSWSSSYPPPSRRSRSRSPARPDYQSEQQRLEDLDVWNADEREQVLGLNRGYDHSRRGRGRSPPPDGGSRKRRRSMSPYERDRYEPRPRYGDDYDPYFRGHSPPRRGHPPRRAPPDPHTFDYPASLKQYADWFRYFFPQKAIDEDNADKAAEQEAGDGSKPRNGIKSHWEQYKKDFSSNQLKTMFEHHRKSPWFAEKYDPSPPYQMLRARIRKEGWRGRLVTFLHELESGKFDSDLNESEPKSPVKDAPANGEPKDSNGATESKVDDELQTNPDVDFDPFLDLDLSRDLNGKSDNKRSNKRDWDRGEEIAVRPEGNQIMIRTIPPDIGRIKLEEACRKIPGFVYLALGDPMQKRNYYRAGWVRFQEDADMVLAMTELSERKIEGFKLHVTHNMRPFLNRVRYAPEIASKPDRLEKDLNNAKTLAALLEEEAYKLRHMKIKLEDTLKVDGDSATQDQADAVDAAQDPTDDDEDEPMERGSDAVERRIEKIMSDLREQNLYDSNDEALWAAKKTQVSLDLYIEYLRAAFLTCYYCCVVSDHLEALHRKCVKHVRKPLPNGQFEEMVRAAEAEKVEKESKMQEEESFGKGGQDEKKSKTKKDDRWKRNDERWLDWLDSKVALLINRDGVDIREYGGKSYDEVLAKAVDPFIKQEDEGKFRCRMCQKLFKATSFVEKHIANKHPESIKEVEDVPYFNNFVLDPYHIQPFTHPPVQMGHTNQMAPPQAYGIQGPLHGGGPQYHQGQGLPLPLGAWGTDLYFSGMGGVYPLPPPRREDSAGRRLSDRIGGGLGMMEGSVIPAGAGLPPKPMSALDTPLSSGNNPRRGSRSGVAQATGPPPPPPPDAKEDPRAAAGKRISYHDMDLVAEGDVELSY